MTQEEIDFEVSVNAGLCLAWNCREKAGRTGFCPKHCSNAWEKIGNNDLRLQCDGGGGFNHVVLKDADDGDVIVVNEDDVEALRDRLTKILEQHRAEDNQASPDDEEAGPDPDLQV